MGMIGSEPTLVTTVPSTGRRIGEHPLAHAVRRSQLLRPLFFDTLAKGPGTIGHLHAADDGFVALHPLTGHRVLLIEDTFTSGARAQSAASALRIAGASAVGIVTAGRVINPSWNPNCTLVWEYARAEPFTFDVCCMCA